MITERDRLVKRRRELGLLLARLQRQVMSTQTMIKNLDRRLADLDRITSP